MIANQRILAVVPARSGSKGIPLKNIKKLNKKPLIEYTGDFISSLDFIDRAIVSTDSDKIGHIAEACGLSFPFKRPDNISGDVIGDIDVLVHALKQMEKQDGLRYDIILMLQPTSPFRREKYLIESINQLIDRSLDSVWSVSPTDSKSHPDKQLKLKNNKLDYYSERGQNIIARQQLDTLYHRNGAVYVFTRDCILKQNTIKGIKTEGYIIEDILVNIDTEYDFLFAEFAISKGLYNK